MDSTVRNALAILLAMVPVAVMFVAASVIAFRHQYQEPPPSRTNEHAISARFPPRRLGVLSLALQLAIPAAFALPFLSMSCGSAKTEPLTGYELLVESDPDWLESDEAIDPIDEEKILVAVRSASFRARIAFGLCLAAVAASIWLVVSNGAIGAAWVLAGTSILGALAYAPLLTPGSGLDDNPTAHHYVGVFLAAALALTAAIVSLASTKSSFARHGLNDPVSMPLIGCGSLIFAGVAAFLFVFLGWPGGT